MTTTQGAGSAVTSTRRLSLLLGLAGGITGLALHAYLLIDVLLQSAPASADFKRFVVGVALGAGALAAVLAARFSRPVSVTFLFSLAVLGLFPNLFSWAPAAVLLIAAGALGVMELRAAAPQPIQQTKPRSIEVAPAVSQSDTGGTSVHWSLAARRPPGSTPLLESVRVPTPSDEGPAPDSRDRTGREQGPGWGRGGKLLATVTVIATAVVVVPFSFWPQNTRAEATEGPPLTAAAVVDLAKTSTTTTTTEGLVATTAPPEKQQEPTSATTLVTTLAMVGPVDLSDPAGFVLYSDVRFGLTVAMPADWAELPASGLADYRPDEYHLAAFADISGPTHEDAYLNGLTIKVLAGSQTEDPPQELVHQTLQQLVAEGPSTHEYFKVVKPIRATTVGGFPAEVVTYRTTWKERVMMKSAYTFIAEHCLYQVEIQTDDADWAEYAELFKRILESFTFGGDTPH